MKKLLAELIELYKADKFNGQLYYGDEISSDSLFQAMRTVGMEDSTQEIIETFLEDAPSIHCTLLAITFSNFLSAKNNDDDAGFSRKSRRAIRLLLNIIQRSPKFASKISCDCVELLETLLMTSQYDVECLLILLKTSDSTWLEFQKSPRYALLLNVVLHKFEDDGDFPVEEQKQSTILAYFTTLLEKDYGFLSMCYADLTTPTFCEVLDVVRVILTENRWKIHQNNLLFVLNLLELITVDYPVFLTAREKTEKDSAVIRKKSTIEMLNLLVEIVGEMCGTAEMASQLNDKATAINAVIDVLDTCLHAESLFADFRAQQPDDWPQIHSDDPKFAVLKQKIEEEKRYEETQRRHVDRPKQPPPSKIPRVTSSESLSQLSQTIFEQYQQIDDIIGVPRVGELKMNCVKAITNLCSASSLNKQATLKNGRHGLLSVLQCTSRRPEYFMESYAMRNYCIFCVRQLTDECNENKEVILNLGQPTQPIIDRKRLLKEFEIDLEGGES